MHPDHRKNENQKEKAEEDVGEVPQAIVQG